MKNKMFSFRVALIVALVASLLIPVGAAFAATHPDSHSFLSEKGVPDGSKLVLNISMKITNDEDSGMVGYWALDNFNKTVKVWQSPDSSFYAIVKYEGNWQTFAGALSPGNGTVQPRDGWGTVEGGYVAVFTATTFTKGHGYVGKFDFGGTKADILLGTYGAGQTGSTPNYDWLGTYFPDAAGFTQTHWGWTYEYQNQKWYNYAEADGGNSGDIITSAAGNHGDHDNGNHHGWFGHNHHPGR
jgi:hypothetical protein